MTTQTMPVRAPAVAGRFYPPDATQLEAEVRRRLSMAGRPVLQGVRAVIAPHAGYVCSGDVAGASFRALSTLPHSDRVVYLLGPAHWKVVHGVALSSAAAFATPLGDVAVAAERVAALAAMGPHYRFDDAAHAPEHCLEVELPFLQVVLGAFRIVPMLFDDVAEPARIAANLTPLLLAHPEDIVVVSSDLSHYHPYQDAVNADNGFLKAVAMGDLAAANRGEACGVLPILCLMYVAEQLGWRPHLLAYANSGDTCGSRREVVGYGAVAYNHT
jgi:AmmeMemoRadiSam system protein B